MLCSETTHPEKEKKIFFLKVNFSRVTSLSCHGSVCGCAEVCGDRDWKWAPEGRRDVFLQQHYHLITDHLIAHEAVAYVLGARNKNQINLIYFICWNSSIGEKTSWYWWKLCGVGWFFLCRWLLTFPAAVAARKLPFIWSSLTHLVCFMS